VRNLGLFTPGSIRPAEVEQFVIARGGKLAVYDDSNVLARSTILGADHDWVYVTSDTSVGNAGFDEEELQDSREQLGFEPKAYIDLHFTSTDRAFESAENLVLEMKSVWGGVVDYSGAGGALGRPRV
jgi:hypothetical protein